MRHRYAYLDPELVRSLTAGMELLRLFNTLILAAGGDAQLAAEWMRELKGRGFIDPATDLEAFLRELEDRQLVQRDPAGALQLGAAGQRRLRQDAFEQVFAGLRRGGPGYHPVSAAGEGRERLPETRPWRFGDDIHRIDAVRSTQNALKRTRGRPELAEEDLEVFETEHLTACATVVAIDISHSMVLYGEDRITPAKTVALALTDLIERKYPRDDLGVIVFGDRAARIEPGGIAAIQAGPFHTNTCEALEVARRMLARKKQPNKQIILITDGKPSAVTEAGGIYKNPYGLDLKIVNRTLEEADRCRRSRVVITTFMLATDPLLQDFVTTLTRANRGRAYFASPYNLGEFILEDFIRHRRRRVN